jgi:bifunctional non-homologous end joining protein LigD
MLATSSGPPSLAASGFVYEPKYDGIRAIASVAPGHPVPEVRLFSRAGNEKTAQFPALVKALARYALRLRAPVLLDGEIVALDENGRPASFQRLQGRLHRRDIAPADDTPTAYFVFDLLRDGPHDLRGLPLTARRAALERVFVNPGSPMLRLTPQEAEDGRDLHARARREGWEGLIAKRSQSRYVSGRRSSDWVKLKIHREQEFVVGGWTAPRGSRAHFGALIVGVHEDGQLIYAGHVGSGFDAAELDRLMAKLRELETSKTPFDVPPPATNDVAHWVRPLLVAQVRFTEWTDDARLRHPTYRGLRDDVDPASVRREPGTGPVGTPHREPPNAAAEQPAAVSSSGPRPRPAPERPAPRTTRRTGGRVSKQSGRTRRSRDSPRDAARQLVVEQLQELERARRKGTIVLPDGETLEVSNLDKVFWPAEGLTKGDLMRYYVQVAPYLLPVVEDRPLVMKRYPNGIRSDAFYQHRAPDPIPPGIRTEVLPDDDVPSRIVGGSLKTLLYLAQLAAISMDPWFSRVQSPGIVDHIAFDLDPMPGVPFETVLDVARWLRDELDHVEAKGVPKTSGSDGLHVYVPMPEGTPYETALLWAQIVATMVAAKHPQQATVERTVRRRGAKVYVDYLQNIEGKTIACAYSARASEFAGVSTPLTWDEVDAGVDRRDFTIRTMPARLGEVGDLWAPLFTMKPPDLRKVERYAR